MQPSRPFLATLALGAAILSCPAGEAPIMTLTSSDKALADGYALSVERARRLEAPKDSLLYPCYEAALPNRNAFCARDVAHQALGGQFIGFQAHNLNMMQWLARSAFHPSQKDFQVSWHLYYKNKQNSLENIYDSWKQSTANFDLVITARDLWRWTGDRAWIDDPDLRRFYEVTTSEFVKRRNQGKIGIFGAGGYNEGNGTWMGEQTPRGDGGCHHLGDTYGVQVQGWLAWADLLEGMGRGAEAAAPRTLARDAIARFRAERWMEDKQTYARGLLKKDGSLSHWYGREASFFILSQLLAEPGPRADAQIAVMQREGVTDGGEAKTYRADCLYPYGRLDEGYDAILAQMAMLPRWNYPECSYTAISHCARWIMGMNPDATRHQLTTTFNLPARRGDCWVELGSVPVGAHVLRLRAERSGSAEILIVEHVAGPSELAWQAVFRGARSLLVDGTDRPGQAVDCNGTPGVGAQLTLAVGAKARIEARPAAH